MSGDQTIIENGRVSATFKAILSILAALSTTAIIGVFVAISQLKDSIGELKITVAVLQSTYVNSQSEYTRLNDAITRINDRVSELERRQRRDSTDRRDSDDN